MSTRAKMTTPCPDCKKVVGAVKDAYNRGYNGKSQWRMTKHSNGDAVCTASRSLVTDDVVTTNKETV